MLGKLDWWDSGHYKVVDVGVEDSLATAGQLFTVWQQIGNVWSQFILTWLFTACLNRFFLAKALKSWILCAFGNVWVLTALQGTALQQISNHMTWSERISWLSLCAVWYVDRLQRKRGRRNAKRGGHMRDLMRMYFSVQIVLVICLVAFCLLNRPNTARLANSCSWW